MRSVQGGFTLLEAATAFLLLGFTLSACLPAAGRLRERLAVVSAREAAVAAVSRVRAAALESGGASLHVDPGTDRMAVEARGRLVLALDLAETYEVDLRSSSDTPFVLRFGPLGLGRAASRTLGFERRGQSVELTLSSYGRVRRR